MKLLLIATAVVGFSGPVCAYGTGQYSDELVLSAGDVFHGGGCRKSSPPGQCCHGGSQPVHCH